MTFKNGYMLPWKKEADDLTSQTWIYLKTHASYKRDNDNVPRPPLLP
jgi:hypothetical protein